MSQVYGPEDLHTTPSNRTEGGGGQGFGFMVSEFELRVSGFVVRSTRERALAREGVDEQGFGFLVSSLGLRLWNQAGVESRYPVRARTNRV